MTFRDNRANSTKQNVKCERYSDMPLFTMIIVHALTAMFSWVSLGNHPILQLSTSCLSRTFSNVISMAESQSIMIHDNGEIEDFCVKWGPNEDHFSSLVLMRTKSSIEDLFATTEFIVATVPVEGGIMFLLLIATAVLSVYLSSMISLRPMGTRESTAWR